MNNLSKGTLSVIVPLFNESANIVRFYTETKAALHTLPYVHEILFVNDGSVDASQDILNKLAANDACVQVIEFSRNFGKEIALTAGLHNAHGDAAIMLDADLQHPPQLIPEFVAQWESGYEVVIGVRKDNKGQGVIKRIGSRLFYTVMNTIAETKIIPNATDFRLISREVIDVFNRFTEKDRITRGLIDWVGFRRTVVYFDAPRRTSGTAGYSFMKLVRLAFSSFISMSLFPLRLAGYLGVFTVLGSGALGLFILVGKYILHRGAALAFSGPAQLAILIVFLIGMVLCCLGLIALYIATIHREVVNRPLYVVRTSRRHSEHEPRV